MTEPSWFAELTQVSDVLASRDRELLDDWDDELPPMTLRLGYLGSALAEHAAEMSPATRRSVFGVVERVVADGSEYDSTAMATGFLEGLDHVQTFDLSSVWEELGPKSQAYLTAWHEFWERGQVT